MLKDRVQGHMHMHQANCPPSYGRIRVTWRDHAVLLWLASVWATPPVNLTPSMRCGNWFVALSFRHFFDAALTRLKTMSFAVSCDRAPLVRTVLDPDNRITLTDARDAFALPLTALH